MNNRIPDKKFSMYDYNRTWRTPEYFALGIRYNIEERLAHKRPRAGYSRDHSSSTSREELVTNKERLTKTTNPGVRKFEKSGLNRKTLCNQEASSKKELQNKLCVSSKESCDKMDIDQEMTPKQRSAPINVPPIKPFTARGIVQHQTGFEIPQSGELCTPSTSANQEGINKSLEIPEQQIHKNKKGVTDNSTSTKMVVQTSRNSPAPRRKAPNPPRKKAGSLHIKRFLPILREAFEALPDDKFLNLQAIIFDVANRAKFLQSDTLRELHPTFLHYLDKAEKQDKQKMLKVKT